MKIKDLDQRKIEEMESKNPLGFVIIANFDKKQQFMIEGLHNEESLMSAGFELITKAISHVNTKHSKLEIAKAIARDLIKEFEEKEEKPYEIN